MSAPNRDGEQQEEPEKDCAWCKIMQQKICKKQFDVSQGRIHRLPAAFVLPLRLVSLGGQTLLLYASSYNQMQMCVFDTALLPLLLVLAQAFDVCMEGVKGGQATEDACMPLVSVHARTHASCCCARICAAPMASWAHAIMHLAARPWSLPPRSVLLVPSLCMYLHCVASSNSQRHNHNQSAFTRTAV